jgi:UDP-glucose 4-epimerase
VHNLVLGGAGFIGSGLCELLLNRGERVHVFDNLTMGNNLEKILDSKYLTIGDIRDASKFREFLSSVRPERIFHLIANSDIRSSVLDPTADYENTFLSTCNLVNAISQSNMKPEVIFASSSAIYGDSVTKISEESTMRPISTYGYMKLASEILLKSYFEFGHFRRLLVVRFPNVVGERLTHGVIHDLIRQLERSPSELSVLGNGLQEKPYILQKTLNSIILQILDITSEPFLEINISPKDEITVRRIVEIICEEMRLIPRISFEEKLEGWKGDVPRYSFNTQKLTNIIKDFQIESSEESVRSAVKARLSHSDL